MPIKTSSGKWKWGNVERSSKKELVQTVYGIWKKNGSKGSFSDFLKGTHESLDESFNLDKTNLYFHGSFDKDIKKIDKPSIEHPFCVTQDIQYSLDYADGGDESDDSANGVVYLVTIDEDSLKIFDFEDDSDIKKLNNKWPAKILNCFSKKHKANKGKLIDPLIVCDLLINDMDYSEDDPEITTLMNTSVLKRLEQFVGKKWKNIFEFRDDPSIKSGEYILRNLLLTDIKDLGFNGYKAHEQSGHSSDKCFILFDLDCMDRIFLKPIPFKDAVAAAEYMDKKFSKSDVDIDYKEHDAAIKEFIRSLKKTKQSLKESFDPNASKIYFHGSLDKSITRLNAPSWKHPFCVTTDLEYALDYAKEFQEMFRKTVSSNPKEGVVYAMTINDSSLKIFDFQNNSDVNKLKGKWPSVMVKAFKSNEYGNSDPLSEITDMILSYEWQEDRSKIAAFNALKKRLESELGIKISRRELENDSTLKYKLRFSFRNLLLKDIQDLGYDGYRASETQIDSTENAFVLINLKDIDKIIPYPIPYKKAEEAVEALYARMKSGEKMELDDEDYEREDRILMAFIDELKNKKKTKTNEGYEPPYTLDTIKQKYGNEVYRKLRDDPVHRFRAETGIEVIHKEPTRDEFERIVKNWDLMTPEQKKRSDEFSMKQFGNNNKNRIDLLRKEYDFEVGDKVKIRSGIRCRQSGHTGTIVRIDPPGTYDYDMHGWSSFIVKMDDPNLGTVGFQSGSIEKLDTVKEYWGKSGKYFYCNDCHKNMSKAPDDQYIMIDDDLWEYVCNHGGKKIGTEEDLCRDCIEKRLGRRITLKDLGDKINLPINDEIRKMLKKKKNIKKESLNEAHEMHSYPEKLQPTIERIVKGNEDHVLDRAYFNKEGKFIWMRNSKGYFHIFKPVKLKNVKWKPFALKDMILQDDGMMKPIDIVQFENGQEGLKYLQNKYDFEVKTMSL